MHSKHLRTAIIFGFFTLHASCIPSKGPSFEIKDYSPADVIARDVAIIGGGSAGTYSAISLKDKGKSSIVIEKKGRLGGHTETYLDPVTGVPIDMGVVVFYNTPLVRDYFTRLNVPFGSASFGNAATVNYNFLTGKKVTIPSSDPTQAFGTWLGLFSKYPTLADGMFLPNPIPEELVMPFGQLVSKYSLQAIVPLFYQYCQGVGDILKSPTVEVMRYFGPNLISSMGTGFIQSAHRNNSELYTSAQNELLADASLLLNSEVIHAQRSDKSRGIKLIVRTSRGNKLICAKKLLIAIPPRLDFLSPFDLSSKERKVFSKLIDVGFYTSIVRNTGLPDDFNFENSVQDTLYNLPQFPAIYGISTTGVPGLHTVYYGTLVSDKTFPVSDDSVKANIITAIQKLQKENPNKFTCTMPEFVDFSSHAPYYLQAKAEDTQAGFYGEMYALQGLRNTYWTGAAWRAEDSSEIWRYTEGKVIPELVKGL